MKKNANISGKQKEKKKNRQFWQKKKKKYMKTLPFSVLHLCLYIYLLYIGQIIKYLIICLIYQKKAIMSI